MLMRFRRRTIATGTDLTRCIKRQERGQTLATSNLHFAAMAQNSI